MVDYKKEITWLDGGQPYIICAYFTESYIDEITQLHQSLVDLKLNHFLFPHEDLGYWEKNTRAKPAFIKMCLEKFKNYNIAYTDADSIFRKEPELFSTIQEDIGVFKATDKSNYFTHDYLTGTIFFRNNENSKKFIYLWIAEQKAGTLQVDQDSFDIAIKAIPELSAFSLPFSYVKVFDQQAGVEPIIEHFQASRKRVKLKNKVRRGRNRLLLALLLGLIAWLIYRYFKA